MKILKLRKAEAKAAVINKQIDAKIEKLKNDIFQREEITSVVHAVT